MRTLTLDMPTDMYQRLAAEANRLGQLPQVMALEWLSTRWGLSTPQIAQEEEDIGGQALRAAGLLTELSPGLSELADPTVRLEDVIAAMARAEGPSLSEIVLEERRSREW